MKLISYKVTCGGDAGFRCSNRDEWCSVGAVLLFDAEKWNVDTIATAIKKLYSEYRALGHTWTLGEVLDHAYAVTTPFINNTDGVYVDADYQDSDGCRLGNLGAKESKQLHAAEHEVTKWSKDGKESNYDYDK